MQPSSLQPIRLCRLYLPRLLNPSCALQVYLAAHLNKFNTPSQLYWLILRSTPSRSQGSCTASLPLFCSSARNLQRAPPSVFSFVRSIRVLTGYLIQHPILIKSVSVLCWSKPIATIQQIPCSTPKSGNLIQPFCHIFVQICPLMGLGPDPLSPLLARRSR
jgi:hypothetical protein